MNTKPPVIGSHQVTTTISRWVQYNRNISLSRLEGITDVRRLGIGWSGNDGIRMNPPGIISVNGPQGTGGRGFEIFDFVAGISDLNNSGAQCHNESIIENPGCYSLFKNYGHENVLKLKNMDAKI